MTTATVPNGTARKSLAEQIDRLDNILDGLAEALNESVAAAVQQAVGEAVAVAVQAAVVEVLTNPQLQKRLHPAGTPRGWRVGAVLFPAVRLVGRCWAGLVGVAKATWRKAASAARSLAARAAAALVRGGDVVASGCRAAAARVVSSVRGFWVRALLALHLARRLRRPLVVAAGVGLLVGLGCYCAGPVVASACSGAAGFAASLAASAWAAVRRALACEALRHA